MANAHKLTSDSENGGRLQQTSVGQHADNLLAGNEQRGLVIEYTSLSGSAFFPVCCAGYVRSDSRLDLPFVEAFTTSSELRRRSSSLVHEGIRSALCSNIC